MTLIEKYNNSVHQDYKFVLEYENTKIHPLFFFGDSNVKGKAVTISLNGAFDLKSTPLEHEGIDSPDDWFELCNNGFLNCNDDKSLNPIFKNLGKVINGRSAWNAAYNKRILLQESLINIDWCFLYSKNFPSNFWKLSKKLGLEPIVNLFDSSLNIMIPHLEPRVIFLHGTSLKLWFDEYSFQRKRIATLEDDYGRTFEVWEGYYQTDDKLYRMVYSEYFINTTSKGKTIDKLHELLYNS